MPRGVLGRRAIRDLVEADYPPAAVLTDAREREWAGVRRFGLKYRANDEPLLRDIRADIERNVALESIRLADARHSDLHGGKSRASRTRAHALALAHERQEESDANAGTDATVARGAAPVGITFVLVLVWIAAIADLIAGIVLLLMSFDDARFADAPVTPSWCATTG